MSDEVLEVALVHRAHGPCPFCREYDQHASNCDHKDWDIDQILEWWARNGKPIEIEGLLWRDPGDVMLWPNAPVED